MHLKNSSATPPPPPASAQRAARSPKRLYGAFAKVRWAFTTEYRSYIKFANLSVNYATWPDHEMQRNRGLRESDVVYLGLEWCSKSYRDYYPNCQPFF